MLDEAGRVLYVGKAKNLKKRVTSYFQRQLDAKTLQLIKQVNSIEITITRNEREALLLESSLIKAQTPRYNVIFRDDKSYPYLKLSVRDEFPRLFLHRGSKQESAKYYGPYPSAREAREALNLLQTIFKLRQCDEIFFKNRTRPCLQYQIKRCSAPCVGYITKDDYQRDVDYTRLFLEGKNQMVIEQLIKKMETASHSLLFEQAARIRDQIALLRGVQEQQIIIGATQDIDVLGISILQDQACIHVLVIREGRMLGSRQYFPNKKAILTLEEAAEETILSAFILQHYTNHDNENGMPSIILLPMTLKNEKDLQDILKEKVGSVQITRAIRGDRAKWLKMAMMSARQALISRASHKMDLTTRFSALQDSLALETVPERIECFDVSHALGEATVVSCVVFDVHGPAKGDYRRYNVRAATGGDDYRALTEGLTRHYTRLKLEAKILPDILLIDGGKGQLACARAVLEELQVTGVILLAVAKGPQRKPGLETVYLSTNGEAKELQLAPNALHLIQQCRDEAHRFAITAHRKQRALKRKTSSLEFVEGIGKIRRHKLLQYFGGLQEISQASVEELAKVPGISHSLAERLYEKLHGRLT
jgi:excinuclease ABC subunit C